MPLYGVSGSQNDFFTSFLFLFFNLFLFEGKLLYNTVLVLYFLLQLVALKLVAVV